MLFRDALAGIYIFGGIYAAGVMGWSISQIGVFGILAILASAVFSWLGGLADQRYGSKPVVVLCVTALLAASIGLVLISPESLFGFKVAAGSIYPDIAFYVLGAVVGSAGGALQASSRALMVAQAPAGQVTEAFGLYALAGKATSFIAPLSIALVTSATGSQQFGILPLAGLLMLSLILLPLVKAEGDRA